MTEYRYGAMNRPAGWGACPAGFLRVDPPVTGCGEVNERLTRHGVVVYPRALTAAEIHDWQLYPYAPSAEIVARVLAGIEADGTGPEYAAVIRGGEMVEVLDDAAWDWIRALGVYTDRPWQEVGRGCLAAVVARWPS